MAYRQLSLEKLKPTDTNVHGQAAPMLQWVKIADLVVDPSYQRDIQGKGRRSIQEIAENFEWTKFAAIVTAPVEGGKFAIIDGQHRATAAALLGLEQVPAQVVIADPKVQAAAFAAINAKVTKTASVQIHAANVTAGDPGALAVDEVCRCAEVTVPRMPGGYNMKIPGRTVAVHAISQALEQYGRDTVITALQCVTQTNNNLPGILRSFVITGLCRVIAASPYWRDAGDRLFRAFDEINLEELAQLARAPLSRASDTSAAQDFAERVSDQLRIHLGAPAPVEQHGQLLELVPVPPEAASLHPRKAATAQRH